MTSAQLELIDYCSDLGTFHFEEETGGLIIDVDGSLPLSFGRDEARKLRDFLVEHVK